MAEVELEVVVSNRANVTAYGMKFKGTGVPMPNDEGVIRMQEGTGEWLQWWMLGEPAGSMKVEVKRGGHVIRVRNASRIPNTKPAGYDRLHIQL